METNKELKTSQAKGREGDEVQAAAYFNWLRHRGEPAGDEHFARFVVLLENDQKAEEEYWQKVEKVRSLHS